MKIVYISNSIIPSTIANSIHVMKMCQAFADNEQVLIKSLKKLKSESVRDKLSTKALENFNKYIWNNRAINIVREIV